MTENKMGKQKRRKRQTMIYNTLHVTSFIRVDDDDDDVLDPPARLGAHSSR